MMEKLHLYVRRSREIAIDFGEAFVVYSGSLGDVWDDNCSHKNILGCINDIEHARKYARNCSSLRPDLNVKIRRVKPPCMKI